MTATSKPRRLLLSLLLALPFVAQASFPERPIRIVVPYPPGGGADILTRLVAQKLIERWGQPVIVDNRPGADTQIGTDAVAKAAPDGYTLGMVTPTVAINKTFYPKASYDLLRDLKAVAMIGSSPFVLVSNPAVEGNSLHEFVRAARAKNGRVNFSASSSITYVTGEAFKQAVGLKAEHIPYKGSAPSVAAVVSGEVDYTFDTVLLTKPLIESGRLRALGISSKTHHPLLPNVPTIAEAGVANFEFSSWYGFIAPAGVSKEIVEKFNLEISKILALPEVKQKAASIGATLLPMSADAFSDVLKKDVAKYGELINAGNLRPSN
jgi:tripartite-type tricarboxylate transporter receptor subunit TctC